MKRDTGGRFKKKPGPGSAHLVDLGNICTRCRNLAAIVELRMNGTRMGPYCRPCGDTMLKELNGE